jgi:hypothetical protein
MKHVKGVAKKEKVGLFQARPFGVQLPCLMTVIFRVAVNSGVTMRTRMQKAPWGL